MNWYLEVLKKYATFTGRARRSEYWYFALFNALISFGLTFLDMGIGTYDPETGNGTISMIYSFGVILPSIAVGVRRMHDVGKSGWYLLIPFYNLYLTIQDSEPHENQYGPNPKNPEEDNLIGHLVD